MTANLDQITYWNETAGAKWVQHQSALDALMAPLTDALMEAAAAVSGERVLDVGCGCGDLALRLARRVAPGGDVLAVDVSRPMLEHARARGAAETEGAPIHWVEGDASTTPFAADRSLIVSRFGVMFFADRKRAFANIRRAAAPGARVAFLTWRRRAEVEWMQAPLAWTEETLGIEAEASDGAIGPFGLADAAATCATLRAAGFADATAIPVDRPVRIGASLDEAVTLLGHTGPAAALTRDAEPAMRAAVIARLRDELASSVREDRSVWLGAGCWIYEARA